MIKRRRVFLKSSVIICHGGVTGIASLGEYAEVSQLESSSQCFILFVCRALLPPCCSMGRQKQDEHKIQGYESKEFA